MQLTQEAILAARQQIADNAQACIDEAICPATSVRCRSAPSWRSPASLTTR